jgi:hypothetical protein
MTDGDQFAIIVGRSMWHDLLRERLPRALSVGG